MSAITELSQFKEVSRTQLKAFIERAKEEIITGQRSALETHSMLHTIQEIAKALKATITEHLMDEIQHEEDVFTRYGYDIQKMEVGTRYDYSRDAKWQELDKAKKEHEKFLKGLRKEMVDPDTGEVFTPPIKRSTSFIKMSRI